MQVGLARLCIGATTFTPMQLARYTIPAFHRESHAISVAVALLIQTRCGRDKSLRETTDFVRGITRTMANMRMGRYHETAWVRFAVASVCRAGDGFWSEKVRRMRLGIMSKDWSRFSVGKEACAPK